SPMRSPCPWRSWCSSSPGWRRTSWSTTAETGRTSLRRRRSSELCTRQRAMSTEPGSAAIPGGTGEVVAFPVPPRRRPIASSGVIGMTLFVIAETMFFAGFVSAFTIVKTTALTPWPPPNQPRLPIESTAVNTLALLASGVVLFFVNRRFVRDGVLAVRQLVACAVLGTFFLVFQGEIG